MTHSPDLASAEPDGPDDNASPTLPLISFVVSNYNYGRFVKRCLDSILSQTYANIECIIVDDASTDDSRELIARAVPPEAKNVTVVHNARNLGQTPTCIEGFKRSRGEYVAFIDADDALLPNYALAHLWTHLTSRSAIGFSSCDLMTSLNGEIVLTTNIDEYLLHTWSRPIRRKETRPLPDSLAPAFEHLPAFKVRQIKPDVTYWIWAPTSGNVYRRTALALFLDNDRLGKLELSTDAYLNFPINALCGSKFIDQAFGIYYVHGGNAFSRTPPLSSMRSFDSEKDFGAFAAYCALEHIVLNFRTFAAKSMSLPHLHRAMLTLARKAKQSTWLLDVLDAITVVVLRFIWMRRLPGLRPRRR